MLVSIHSSLRSELLDHRISEDCMTSGKVLIIGGGPAGLEAARCIAELGGETILIEKRERLGGTHERESYAKLTHTLR